MTTRTVVGVWTLAMVAAVGALALVLRTNHADAYTGRSVLAIAVGLAFVAAGLVAWYRRPENRTGWIMVVAGFAWFLGALTQANHPLVFTLGTAVNDLPWAVFAYLVLSYPTGRLEGLACKAIVAGAFGVALVLRPVWMLFSDLREDHPNGPENAFLVDRRPDVADAIETAIQAGALVLIASAIYVLVRRWRAATPPLRRTLGPAFLTYGVTVLALAVAVFLEALELEVSEAFFWVALVALLTVPLSFAVGLLRTRLARAGVSSLLLEIRQVQKPGDLRDALARALGDPSLEVAYHIEDGAYVDVEGNRVELPDDDDRRATTKVEREGRCVAALVHDPSLREDRALVEAAAAAAGLALENEQRLAALAESEARHRALLDAMPDLMFRISKDGTYLEVKGNERDLAAPREKLVGSNVHEVLPREAADQIMRCAESVLDSGRLQTVEYQLRIGPLNRHFEARIVKSGEDEVLLIVRDISDRKRAETQLQRLQEELRARFEDLRRERDFIRTVVQAAPSFFCVVDSAARIVRFNQSLERASGVKDDESVRGRLFWEVFAAPTEADEVRERLLDACSTAGPSPEYENRWLSSDGSTFVVAWSETPVVDERGGQRCLVTGMDVTERKRQEEELRSSRARIVEAAAAERRRLERNLHDGAQQRLVSISLFLRLAQGKIQTDPEGAEQLLAKVSDELAHALEELRELARGIHPAVLTDRGLEPALQALVSRAPVPVTVAQAPGDRLPEPVEAAAYYVVSEALANVVKYARASAATVRVSREDGRALVEVADDGVGGADPTLGSGLRGLVDRVEALDGRLEVESPPGRGTTIRAEIPCA